MYLEKRLKENRVRQDINSGCFSLKAQWIGFKKKKVCVPYSPISIQWIQNPVMLKYLKIFSIFDIRRPASKTVSNKNPWREEQRS